MLGCVVLFCFLSAAKWVFPIWAAIGMLVYLAYGVRHSRARDGGAGELEPGGEREVGV